MADLKAVLIKLTQNLNILRERESKYGGNVPLELFNQIEDYQTAILLTQQVIQGDLTAQAWREALKPLLVSLNVFGDGFTPSEQILRDDLIESDAYNVLIPILPTDLQSLTTAEENYCELVRKHCAEAALYYIDLASETTDERVMFNTLQEGIDKYPCFLLLGGPGSGKTTALKNLAYQLAVQKEQLPILLDLSKFKSGMTLTGFIIQSLSYSLQTGNWEAPQLAANLNSYLKVGRLYFLFDALNEMSQKDYDNRTEELHKFINQWAIKGNRFLVTCRTLDYSDQLSGLQQIELRPLSDEQIEDFLIARMASEDNTCFALWQQYQAATGQARQQYLTKQLHKKLKQCGLQAKWQGLWKILVADRKSERQLLELIRNPYLLTMMVRVFQQDKRVIQNRVELLQQYTQAQLKWGLEKTPTDKRVTLSMQEATLAKLAFEMLLREKPGATIETELIREVMPKKIVTRPNWPPISMPLDRVLDVAASANIIEMPIDRSKMRFYHQLLQEYFAACELVKFLDQNPESFQNGEDLSWRFWVRPEDKPTGWEETTILAAGLADKNADQLLHSLLRINPVLAGRCLCEGQAKVEEGIRQAVTEVLLGIISQREFGLRVRITAGEVLGYLGDPRLGKFITIPAGEFIMGDNPQYVNLPTYQISRYPLTNAEFADFIKDGGYKERRWWTEMGWVLNKRKKEDIALTKLNWANDHRFNKPNQPVVGISWYEAVAYCRWRSRKTNQLYRLPTEAEWEKATRGTDGRNFPWGNDFDPTRVNMNIGEEIVSGTTPVGIYPTGRSFYDLDDCAGNTLEWCSTRAEDFQHNPYRVEDEWNNTYLEETVYRILRGSSWRDSNKSFARCTQRYRKPPDSWLNTWGMRLVIASD